MSDKDFIAKIVAELDQASLNATVSKINSELGKVKIDFGKEVFRPLEIQAMVAARTMEDTFRKSIAAIRTELASLNREMGNAPAGVSPQSIARRPPPTPPTRGAGEVTASDIVRSIYMQLGKAAQNVPAPKSLQYVSDPSNARNRFLMQYEIAELSSLTPSTSAAYKGYQPRTANTEASRQKIREIKATLDAEQLVFRSPFANVGAPIIDPLGYSISGSHRLTAMQQLAAQGGSERLAAYVDYLKANAEQFGFTPEQVSTFKQPILIQRPAETMTPASYKLLAEIANRDPSVRESPSVRAMNDAMRITAGSIVNMNSSISNSLSENIERSTQLIREVFNSIPTTSKAEWMTQTGGYSQALLDRTGAALFARVFPGEAGQGLLKLFAEEPDAESPVKRIENALMRVLPGIARVQALSGTGGIAPGLDIAPDLADAISNYVAYRKSGLTFPEFTGPSMFEPSKFNATQVEFMQMLDTYRNKQGQLIEKLNTYVTEALNTLGMSPEMKASLVGRTLGINYANPMQIAPYQPVISAPDIAAEQLQAAIQKPISDQLRSSLEGKLSQGDLSRIVSLSAADAISAALSESLGIAAGNIKVAGLKAPAAEIQAAPQVQQAIGEVRESAANAYAEMLRGLNIQELKLLAKEGYPGVQEAIAEAEAAMKQTAEVEKQIAAQERRAASAAAKKLKAAQAAAEAAEKAAAAEQAAMEARRIAAIQAEESQKAARIQKALYPEYRNIPGGPPIAMPPIGGQGNIPIGLPPAGGYGNLSSGSFEGSRFLVPYPGLGLPAVIPGMAGFGAGGSGGTVPPGGAYRGGLTGGFNYGGGFVIPPGMGNPNIGMSPNVSFAGVSDIFKAMFGKAFQGVKTAFSPENLIAGKNPIWGSMGAGVNLAQQFAGVAQGGAQAKSVIESLGLSTDAVTIGMAQNFAGVAVAMGAVAAGAVMIGKAYLEAYQSSQKFLNGVGQIQRTLGATAQQASEISNLLALTPHGADNPFAAISLTQLQANLQAMNDYERGLIKTNSQLEQFIQGMNRLGLSAVDSQGKVKSITDIVIDASEKLQGLSGGEYTRALQQLTGLFGSVDIAPLIGIDPQLLREYRDSAVQVTQEQLNLNIQRQIATQAAINAEQQFNLQLTEAITPLDIQIQKLKQRAIVAATAVIAPTDQQKAEQLTQQMSQVRKDIAYFQQTGNTAALERSIRLMNSLQSQSDIIRFTPEFLSEMPTERLQRLAQAYSTEASRAIVGGATDDGAQYAAQLYQSIKHELDRRAGTLPIVNLFEQMMPSQKIQFGKDLGKYINDQTKDIIKAQKDLAKSQADYVKDVTGTVETIIKTGVQYEKDFEKYSDLSTKLAGMSPNVVVTTTGKTFKQAEADIKKQAKLELQVQLDALKDNQRAISIAKAKSDDVRQQRVLSDQIADLNAQQRKDQLDTLRKIYGESGNIPTRLIPNEKYKKALEDLRKVLGEINRETLGVGIDTFKNLLGQDAILKNEEAFNALKKAGVEALDALAKSAGVLSDSGFAAALGEAALQAKLLVGGFGDLADPNQIGAAFSGYLDALSGFKTRITELLPFLGDQPLTIPIAVDFGIITTQQGALLKDPQKLDRDIKALMGMPGDEVAVQADLKLLIDTKNIGADLFGGDPKARTEALIQQIYKESGLDQATLQEAFEVAFELREPEADDIQEQVNAVATMIEETKLYLDVELRFNGVSYEDFINNFAGGAAFKEALAENPLFTPMPDGLTVNEDALSPTVNLARVNVDVDQVEADLIAQKSEVATEEQLNNVKSTTFTGSVGTITLFATDIDVSQVKRAIENALNGAIADYQDFINRPANSPNTLFPPLNLPPVQGPGAPSSNTYPVTGANTPFALGGYPNGLSLVGENGRELFIARSGYILSNTITDKLLDYARGGSLGGVPVARTASDRLAYNQVSNISTATTNYTLNVDARGAQGGRGIRNTIERIDVRGLFQSNRQASSMRRAQQLRGG